jgi:hypothetical protein
MTRLKPSRLVAARNEARSLLWQMIKELPVAVVKWIRIEWTVTKMLWRL